ncbi:discoidin domain-containing protein [Oscillibacter sp. MSJ-2]|uniref:Discoidin domain-containing protein n=1 Tax=Dysosmobacter acutus TaxID=2841504 RepID=A0ABS6FB92_9FIRM|nr:discoidin domain-containing protein [Dysosmobacter acutus]MBU5626827.1 discoidin domain-containing protein [Dysosmobacter acutus]
MVPIHQEISPPELCFIPGKDRNESMALTAPMPESSPRLDEVCTDARPLLTWRNSDGGIPPRKYILQMDTDESFCTTDFFQVEGIPEDVYISAARVEKELKDKTQWFWRVKAVDSMGVESDWSTEYGGITARFFIDTAEKDSFEYLRLPISDITTSFGYGKENILDRNDKSETYWEGAAGQSSHWIRFDLGEPKLLSRIFMTSGAAGWRACLASGSDWANPSNLDGRLAEYIWQYSNDDKTWTDIAETERRGANSFRAVIDLEKDISARYVRLCIRAWHGRSPKIYDILLYSRAQPAVPEVPHGNYVLVISNIFSFVPEKGIVKTDFGKMIKGTDGHIAPPWDLDVLELPAHMFSLKMFEQIKHKPLAIFLSGSPNVFCQLPLFEFNGEYELIRTTNIPVWGSCAGIQMMGMAYGSTAARDTGRSYRTNELQDIIEQDIPPISIQKEDPIWKGMSTPFYGTELHSWMVSLIPEGWEILATSKDSKGFVCNEMIRATGRLMYGSQFHPEIAKPFNCAKELMISFLSMAVNIAKNQGTWITQLSAGNFS